MRPVFKIPLSSRCFDKVWGVTMDARKPRGPYAKGSAKREEIIEKAIEAFGRTGYHGTSMREIAANCDLSQAGLLHHFPSKEDLLLAIVAVRERIADDNPYTYKAQGWREAAREQVILNEQNEALTRLWANLVGEATDPAHPAHDYFKTRYANNRAGNAQNFAEDAGHQSPTEEDKIKAALMTALWDGLQTQWLIDESFDMKPAFEYAIKMLTEYKA